MEQVADTVFRLGSRSHNFYLLADQGEATVIDAGCSREWSQLADCLDRLDMSPSSVSAVVATHAHADHLGFGARAAKEGIDVRVHVEEETRALGSYQGRFSAKATDLPMYRISTWKNFLPMLIAGVMSLEHVESVTTFADGEVLDVPGLPRVVYTPGHTEGHTMFHCADEGILFTGDGLVTMSLLGRETGPRMMDTVFNLDTEQAYASLDRVADISADTILSGHGEPWHGSPADAVRAALAARVSSQP